MGANFDNGVENSNSNMNEQKERENSVTDESTENRTNEINRFSLDEKGNLYNEGQGAAAAVGESQRVRTYIILGWVSVAFTALLSPLFAVAGIIFGLLANKQARGRGNAVIITSIVLAAVNILFGYLLMDLILRAMD